MLRWSRVPQHDVHRRVHCSILEKEQTFIVRKVSLISIGRTESIRAKVVLNYNEVRK